MLATPSCPGPLLLGQILRYLASIRMITETSQDHFISTVLHDWEDEEGAQILRSLIPAMAPGSKILTDKMVLPNTRMHWWSASLDLHMYAMLGSMERNEDHWMSPRRSLLHVPNCRISRVQAGSRGQTMVL